MAVDAGPLIGVVAGAVVAALGYVGKLGVESWREWHHDRAERLARLLQLQALLRAGRTAFQVQRELAGRLEAQLRHKYPNDLPDEPGFERMFTHLYDRFEPEQAELHSVIRAYTEHALYPTNRAIADWLRADVDYRTIRGTSQPEVRLAKLLNELDCHLTLWLAKHGGWLPDPTTPSCTSLTRRGMGWASLPKSTKPWRTSSAPSGDARAWCSNHSPAPVCGRPRVGPDRGHGLPAAAVGRGRHRAAPAAPCSGSRCEPTSARGWSRIQRHTPGYSRASRPDRWPPS